MYRGAIMFQLILVFVASAVAATTTPSFQIYPPRSAMTRPKPPPPIVNQCFYENRWYPTGSIINEGRSNRWCYGAFCDVDGHVKFWNDHNCPMPDQQIPQPPSPNNIPYTQDHRNTHPSYIPSTAAPVTTLPPTAPPIPYTQYHRNTHPPYIPTTSAPIITFPATAQSIFNPFGQCFYRGSYFRAGEDINNRRFGSRCYGSYCDYNSKVQHWSDECRFTLSPIPTTTPDLT